MKANEPLIKTSIVAINNILVACFNLNHDYLFKCGKLPEVQSGFCDRCSQIVAGFELLHKYDQNNKQVIDNIIDICKRQIEGVKYNPIYPLTPLFYSHLRVSQGYKSELETKMNEYFAKRKALPLSN